MDTENYCAHCARPIYQGTDYRWLHTDGFYSCGLEVELFAAKED